MALKPIVGEIKAQVLNDNFSYIRQLAEEAGTDPELEQKVNNLIARIGNNEDLDTTEKSKIILAINEIYQDLVSHKADTVYQQEGVHGLKIEEGVWTPKIEGSTTPGTHTYSTQTGNYIRIGKLVHIQFTVAVNTKDINMAGNVRVSGLPFINDAVGSSILSHANIALGSDRTGIEAGFATGAPFFSVNQIGSGLPLIPLPSSGIVDGSRLSGSLTYRLRG